MAKSKNDQRRYNDYRKYDNYAKEEHETAHDRADYYYHKKQKRFVRALKVLDIDQLSEYEDLE